MKETIQFTFLVQCFDDANQTTGKAIIVSARPVLSNQMTLIDGGRNGAASPSTNWINSMCRDRR